MLFVAIRQCSVRPWDHSARTTYQSSGNVAICGFSLGDSLSDRRFYQAFAESIHTFDGDQAAKVDDAHMHS